MGFCEFLTELFKDPEPFETGAFRNGKFVIVKHWESFYYWQACGYSRRQAETVVDLSLIASLKSVSENETCIGCNVFLSGGGHVFVPCEAKLLLEFMREFENEKKVSVERVPEFSFESRD